MSAGAAPAKPLALQPSSTCRARGGPSEGRGRRRRRRGAGRQEQAGASAEAGFGQSAPARAAAQLLCPCSLRYLINASNRRSTHRLDRRLDSSRCDVNIPVVALRPRSVIGRDQPVRDRCAARPVGSSRREVAEREEALGLDRGDCGGVRAVCIQHKHLRHDRRRYVWVGAMWDAGCGDVYRCQRQRRRSGALRSVLGGLAFVFAKK